MMTSAAIRQQFLDFFRARGHAIVPSAPIVIKNDPTLLFTNAGMNQFKDFFLGNKKPAHTRVADTQKCLRVSGKHNDLEEVGVDTYHHTMFEMLGNWSFGDYFKKEAIAWSWELLTGVYQLDKERLYVTVFEGDAQEGLEKDEEALTEWQRWISPERILTGNKKDNFWEMGDTGPCGPCSEIHVDCRPDAERAQTDGSTLVNKDHPQVIEIWNNVFMQFNRLKDGTLVPLPARHVDTGMGFERLVRVIQKKQSNYDTDLFMDTINTIEQITQVKYGNTDSRQDIAFRVLADHIRAISFTIADGQLPSNTGAGYVIRRILRRAVRYAYTYLGQRQPLLYQLVPVVAKQFQQVFPELHLQQEFVCKVVREEEESFLRTLEKGLNHFEAAVEMEQRRHPESGNSRAMVLPGKAAFELNDTYGFPLDLTRLIAAEKGWSVDEAGFDAEMQIQKNRSRAATALDTGDWTLLSENKQTQFVGYDSTEAGACISRYRKVKAKGKEFYHLVLDVTPFYAESGGQVGDTGELVFTGDSIQIVDTKKENDLILHVAEVIPEDITGTALAKIDVPSRRAIATHHSATHLLHAALRQVLGNHVAQKGSLVNAEHLRFDFSHFAKTTPEEIAEVEKIVNRKIRENIRVDIREMKKEEALKLGAMALFGEKYGDLVRVVIIDPEFSVELCGGTHVQATGEIGYFKIKQETAVAAGVRRIEAVGGEAAEDFVEEQLAANRQVRDTLNNPKDVFKALENLLSEQEELKKQVDNLQARQLVTIRNGLLQKDEIINQINFIGSMVEVQNPDALKRLCFDLKNHLRDYVAILCANIGGKPHVVLGIAENVVAARGLDAAKIIRDQVAPLIRGGGGGQKTLATAGGQDAGNLQAVIEMVRSLL